MARFKNRELRQQQFDANYPFQIDRDTIPGQSFSYDSPIWAELLDYVMDGPDVIAYTWAEVYPIQNANVLKWIHTGVTSSTSGLDAHCITADELTLGSGDPTIVRLIPIHGESGIVYVFQPPVAAAGEYCWELCWSGWVDSRHDEVTSGYGYEKILDDRDWRGRVVMCAADFISGTPSTAQAATNGWWYSQGNPPFGSAWAGPGGSYIDQGVVITTSNTSGLVPLTEYTIGTTTMRISIEGGSGGDGKLKAIIGSSAGTFTRIQCMLIVRATPQFTGPTVTM